MYNKKDNETIKDYKLRLFRNKNIYNLNNQEIADLINAETGDNFSESVYRKWFKPYEEGYKDGLKDNKNNEILKEYEEKRIKFEKEKIKFFNQRNAYNKLIREETNKDINVDIILNEIYKLKPYNAVQYDVFTNSNNDLLIGLNDIHFGCNIHNYWNIYNSEIAKLRLERYLNRIIEIRNIYKSENCYVCANGDLISGNIHPHVALSNKENVIQQVMGVSELISWFLSELSKKFNLVHFAVVAGNHSRLGKKDESPIYERLDDLIPWYIKARLNNNNKIIVIDKTIDGTLNLINIRGKNYLNVHGDYDGFKSIEKLISMIDESIYCVHFGHLHHNATDTIQGYKVIMSGSLMGMDDYCVSKRIYSKAEQLVCVCTEEGIFSTHDIILQ